MIEEWKTIKDLHNYDVSNFGRVRNNKTCRILKPKLIRGYESVCLRKDNKIFRIHNYLKTLFRFPTTEIKIDGWEKYIIEG